MKRSEIILRAHLLIPLEHAKRPFLSTQSDMAAISVIIAAIGWLYYGVVIY